MRHVFLVNPVSGKADASLTLVPRIVEACAAAGVDYEITLTEYPGHGARLARQWAETGEPVRLYACGGDGTFNEVLRGAMGWANAAVGCVPCGSGNDFIRNYGTAEQFLNLDAQLNGSEQAIDLMETSAGLCASICAAGLDAQVAYGIPKFRRLPFCGGSMAYKLSIVQNVCGPLGHRLAIQMDDEQLEEDCLMVAICNGSCYGGGFCAAPQASLQDGLLDVIVVRKVSRLRIAKVISLYKTGAHLKNGQVVPELADVTLGVSCANTLAMADACAMAAIGKGVGEVKAAAYCVNTADLRHIAALFAAKGAEAGIGSTLAQTQIRRILEQAAWMCQTGRSKTSPFDNGVQAGDGTFLTAHDDREAVMQAAANLGYDLSEEDGTKV